MNSNYTTAEDFAADESFQSYILKHDHAKTKEWNTFIRKNPQLKDQIEEAEFLVFLLSPPILDAKQITSKPSIKQDLKDKTSNRRTFAIVSKIAAIFAILIASIFVINNYVTAPAEYNMITESAVDQNTSILLSDLSHIDLRKGSELKFLESWEGQEKRELWLDGEAYFSVKKIDKVKKPFLVHTNSGTISVLGTKFLVKSNDESSKVILEEGSVEFLADGKTYEMVPGDILIKTPNNISVEQGGEARAYDSWRNGKLAFKNKQLKDVIFTLNNSYGLNVELQNKSIETKKISATAKKNDPEMVLKAISEIYDIDLIYNENKIILR